jgi:hypothetical protein
MITSINEFKKYITVNEAATKEMLMQKMEMAEMAYPKQYQAILLEKGADWIFKQMWGVTPEDNAVSVMATILYYHFQETESGKSAWSEDGQSDEKVDNIIDTIDAEYIGTDNALSFTEQEWLKELDGVSLSSEVYDSVSAGVF